MQQREGPSRAGVMVIEDYERRDRVRDGESAERFEIDVSVVTTEIPNQDNEDPGLFSLSTEELKRLVGVPSRAEVFKAEAQRRANAPDNLIHPGIERSRPHECQIVCLVLVLKGRAYKTLAGKKIADQRIEHSLVDSGYLVGQSPEILATISAPGRLRQIESEQRTPVLLRHPNQYWPGRLGLPRLKSRYPIRRTHSPSLA